MHIVLYQPEIPPTTGHVARLCAGTATSLHLIEPVGFKREDRYLKRAGLDYWPHVEMRVWKSFDHYLEGDGKGRRMVATSARQGKPLHRFSFTLEDSLVFGPETRGLPPEWRENLEHWVRIPTLDAIRSLNLSTAAGITLYFALCSAGLLDALAEHK